MTADRLAVLAHELRSPVAALVALGNVGRPEDGAAAQPYTSADDPMLAETAEWALARIAERAT